jgi:hypothetical protein
LEVRSDVILDISIIISIEQIGPVLRGTTSTFLENSQKEAKVILYFTQRVVFTLGIGNEQVKFDKFHGPIELIGDVDIDQEVLLFPVKLVDKDSPDPRIQRFGKDLIICVHYKTEDRSIITQLLKPLYKKIEHKFSEYVPNKEYKYINDEDKAKSIATKLKSDLNKFVELRLEAYNFGPSLFNLATLRQMDEKRRAVGSYLLGNINGADEKELQNNLGVDLSKEDLKTVLSDLIDMGYVLVDKREDKII